MQLDIMISISTSIFTKLNSIYTRQTLQFLFKFLRINLGKGTLYYNLYRDIKVNVNRPRLIVEPRISEPIRIGLVRSKRSKVSEISHKSYRSHPDWLIHFIY